MSSVPRLPAERGESVAGSTAAVPVRELDAMLGELAHSVANSLNAIAASSELAELLITRNEFAGARTSLARIESECMRAARLIREGRKFVTFGINATSEAVDLVALLRGCTETFAERVDVDAGGSIPKLRGDAAALHRMFTEILGNAFEFGASKVRVGLRQETSGQVRIDFHDDGPGITAPVARLFAPFFSTRPAQHSGLGLALAARIAIAHGGSIGADEKARHGAFWIKLPARSA